MYSIHRICIKVLMALLFLVISNSYASSSKTLFGGAEHIFIGDDVKVYFSTHDKGEKAHLFHFPNGLAATYGDILSFGDFYEIEGWTISRGKNETDRKARFLAAFHSFTEEPAKDEANKLLAVLHEEQDLIKAAMNRGEDPSKILKEMSNEIGRKLNCITGGGCNATWWLNPGRFLRLAEVDYDHFGADAWIAYSTGHTLAIETAIKARDSHDLKKLETAYAMNAFASHFLSDRFAAGHMRTPRYELSTKVTPSLTGSILSTFMHGEENAYGLHVHNIRGDRWFAFGDKLYFSPGNAYSRKMQAEALQNSANQIFTAYQKGFVDDDVNQLIPHPNEVHNGANMDISPLFYWDSKTKKLMRREDVTNVYDKRWTSKWWGWSTLALLSNHYGLPPEIQAKLALSTFNTKAIHDGLITDKSILESLKTTKK